MNIKIVKLISGEEIVVEVTKEDSETLSFKNALALMISPSRDGKQLSYGFVPFGAMISGDITIKQSNVLYVAEPNDELKNNYSGIFGGIVTPPKTLITG